MRLIDIDELMKRMCSECLNGKCERRCYEWHLMNNALTVDPVKHGHWTDRAKSIIGVPTEACSECAEWSIGFDKDYCPNCGAKMDEVTDE